MSTPPSNQPSRRTRRRKGDTTNSPNSTEAHNVRLSKSLSYILRHGALKEGLKIRPDGFVRVDDILALPRFRSYTLQDIQHVVDNNDKKRFTLESFPDDTGHNTEWWIRANQGHSIAVDELALTPIVDPNELPTLVHGTYHRNWVAIQREGLSRMNRNHIHLATGLIGEDGVISGMRASSQVYIYVDAARAMADGILFFRSANNVILTAGIDNSGILPTRYFSRVVDRNGNILLDATRTDTA